MLHQAASRGDLQIVNILLKAGADSKIEDNYKFNAYGLAMREE